MDATVTLFAPHESRRRHIPYHSERKEWHIFKGLNGNGVSAIHRHK